MQRQSRIAVTSLALLAMSIIAPAPAAYAQATCGSSVGPDVIVGELSGWNKYGTVITPEGSISGYAFGTTSCNMGNAVLPWKANSHLHPVIAMHAYRLKDHRIEQIGMSWVKHGWGASALNACCTCIDPNNFEALGIGCSDPYDGGTNGIQQGFFSGGVRVSGLGPRSEINPHTGAFIWPYGAYGLAGDAIYKRLQINIDDLDPALNPGAMYFAEAQYITPNDAAAGNDMNNTGYRHFTVGALTGDSYTLSFGADPTQRQKSAIHAWAAADSSVSIVNADVPGDGRFMLGTRVSNNGDGTWHYEYAMYNYNCDRGAQSFTVPSPVGVVLSNFGFHDVPHHSGEPFDGTDWQQIPLPGGVQWATTLFASNPNANAIRWGTLYNFRFDADSPPRNADVTLGLFKPGTPTLLSIPSQVPGRHGDANGDNLVNVADLLVIITNWGACPAAPAACAADLNGDGQVNIADLLLVITNWG